MPRVVDRGRDDEVECAVCSWRKKDHHQQHGHMEDWMDPEDHWEAHFKPPHADNPNCDTCQAAAEAAWEARFER